MAQHGDGQIQGTAVTEYITFQRGPDGKEEFERQAWEDTRRRSRNQKGPGPRVCFWKAMGRTKK